MIKDKFPEERKFGKEKKDDGKPPKTWF